MASTSAFRLRLSHMNAPFQWVVAVWLMGALPAHVWGQTGRPPGAGRDKPKIAEVHGMVMDQDEQAPLPFASVVLISTRDSSVVAGVMSDDQGRFDMTEIEVGRVWLEVRFPGYETTRLGPQMLSPRPPGLLNWQVGTVAMKADITALEEAVVVEQASVMEMRVDRKIFHVGSDLTSRGSNTTELLENIPSVAVDIDGNITLRGSSGVQILIDGRPSGLAGGAREAFLESLPASAVERVELITNPSARFDPDGTAGILNIVLKKNRLEGISGQVQATYGTGDNHDANASLNYRNSEWSISTNLGWNDRWMYMAGEKTQQSSTSLGTSNAFISEPGDSHRASLSGSFKAEWRATSSWTLFAGVNANQGIRDGWDSTLTRSGTHGMDGFLTDSIMVLRSSVGNSDSQGGDAFWGFEKTFHSPDQKWTGDIRRSNNSRAGDNHFEDSSLVGGRLTPVVHTFNDEVNANQRWLAQTDFESPWGREGKIELGAKATWNQNLSDLRYSDATGEQMIDGIAVPRDPHDTIDYRFEYDETIYAAYATAGQRFGMLGTQLGLRAEQAYTTARLDEVEGSDEPFENNYFRLYPSVNLFVDTDGENTWSLSYSRRVNRPRGREISPFEDRSDPRNIRRGNERLLPEFTNSFEAGHQWKRNKASITTSLFFKDTRDVIRRVIQRENGINISTYNNQGRQHNEGLEVVLMVPLGKSGRLNWSSSAYRIVNDTAGLSSPFGPSGFSWSSRFFASWTVKSDWKFQANSFIRGASITPQGRFNGFATVNLAMSRDLPGDHWQVTLQAKDIFNTRKWSYSTTLSDVDELFTQEVWRQRESRNVYLTLQYKFGKLEERGRRGPGDRGSGGGDDFMME